MSVTVENPCGWPSRTSFSVGKVSVVVMGTTNEHHWTQDVPGTAQRVLTHTRACAFPPLSPSSNPTRLRKSLGPVGLPVEVGFSEDSLAPRHTPLAAPWAVV